MEIDPKAIGLLRGIGRPIWQLTLEEILTSPRGFGLTTASPLQRAICRILDGLPLGSLALDEGVQRALGGAGALRLLPLTLPKELVLLAGIRSGKSLLVAAVGVRAALTCDVSRLGPGEVPRVSIVATKMDAAQPTWDHACGRVLASPDLRALLIDEPKTGSFMLRHPSGRPVEIRVVAGSRAANSLVARWSAGVIFDEAPRMLGQEDGVVNLDDARHAVAGRLLPGAQVMMSGSSWAPFGPVYELVLAHHGRPSPDIVVIRARGPDMNPAEWTPEKCEELRKRNAKAYAVDVETEFLDPESSMFDAMDLEALATLGPPLGPPSIPGVASDDAYKPDSVRHYVAAIDPATRGNAWTLVVLSNAGSGRIEVNLCKQWQGSSGDPLSPREVFREMAALLKPFAIEVVESDQWAADPLRDIAMEHGLYLRTHAITAPIRVVMAERVKTFVAEKRIYFPREPMLLRDLAAVRKRVTQSGLTVELPRTADGRHADYAAALFLACAQNLPEPESRLADDATRRTVAWQAEAWREQLERQRGEADAERQRDAWADDWEGFSRDH